MPDDFESEDYSSALHCNAAASPRSCASEDVHLEFLSHGVWPQSHAISPFAAPHWPFYSVSTAPGHRIAAESCAGDSAEDWAISTASVVHSTLSSAGTSGQNLTDSTCLVGCGLDCSDPLIRTAQELIASAVACLPPGMHAAAGDSAALLNSGAVLLLGQGSTTMCGTNTAQGAVHASTAGCLLTPEDCHSSQVFSIPEDPLQDHDGAVPVYSAQQHTSTVLAISVPATWHNRSRRRQGLLIDSSAAGLQHLAVHVNAAAAEAAFQSAASTQLELGMAAVEQQQQDQQSQSGVTAPSLATHRQRGSMKLACLDPTCSSTPASEDVLVLGISRCSTAEGTAVHATASESVAASSAVDSNQALGVQAAAAAAVSTGQPVLQLLSCGSLTSSAHPGRSNSSLLLPSLSNCSVLRLGSFTTTHGSFTTTHSSFTSADGSFTSQRNNSFGAAQQQLVLSAAAASGSSPSPGPPGQPGAAPVSKPSPLPMLHESCSWGSRLDEASGPAARQQQQHGQGQRQSSSGQRQQQLIYLLD